MHLDNIKDFFENNDKYAKHNEIKIDEIDLGYAKTSMKIKEFHLNGANVVHGGAIFTLADYTFAIASNSYGELCLGINATISYISGAKLGEKIFAIAKEINKNHKLGTYEVTVMNERDEIIASFQGMVYRKNIQII